MGTDLDLENFSICVGGEWIKIEDFITLVAEESGRDIEGRCFPEIIFPCEPEKDEWEEIYSKMLKHRQEVD